MNKVLLLILLVAFASALPTVDDLLQVKAHVKSFFDQNRDVNFIAGIVRLMFHDCVGPGFCDGCIDYQNPDNAGLARYTTPLNALFDANFAGKMSRADFYAISSIVAIEEATAGAPDGERIIVQDFKLGRRDCSSSPNEDKAGKFPAGKFNLEEMLAFFKKAFDFNADQVTALLGAHSLGRARVENSGYEGPWVRGRDATRILDNRYYQLMIQMVRWDQMPITFRGTTKFQWQKPGTVVNSPNIDERDQRSMFLNVDMALAWAFVGEKASCVICRDRLRNRTGCCVHSSTHDTARRYSQDNALFIRDFKDVFMQMINKNTAELTEVEIPTTLPPSPQPVVRPRRGGSGKSGSGKGGSRIGGRGGGGGRNRGDTKGNEVPREKRAMNILKEVESTLDRIRENLN
ncbi:putative ascorbate peroxidase [Hydractinia symbiolongicarpus]|uniref:putative ascorbate peroxidase n=1 Tax=Hydractinia symbiolongicarpus TaxID=13093 RepID=UPI00254B40E7|nr:putative ascorbate peroxidase [Hydractinia symbiolongicarpus]